MKSTIDTTLPAEVDPADTPPGTLIRTDSFFDNGLAVAVVGDEDHFVILHCPKSSNEVGIAYEKGRDAITDQKWFRFQGTLTLTQ